jgi:hypothetical protein
LVSLLDFTNRKGSCYILFLHRTIRLILKLLIWNAHVYLTLLIFWVCTESCKSFYKYTNKIRYQHQPPLIMIFTLTLQKGHNNHFFLSFNHCILVRIRSVKYILLPVTMKSMGKKENRKKPFPDNDKRLSLLANVSSSPNNYGYANKSKRSNVKIKLPFQSNKGTFYKNFHQLCDGIFVDMYIYIYRLSKYSATYENNEFFQDLY